MMLNYFNNSIKASTSLTAILSGKNNRNELTAKEKKDFYIVCGWLMLLMAFVPLEKIIDLSEQLSIPSVGIEVILSLCFWFFAFCTSFIIWIELMIPLKQLRNLCEYLTDKMGKIMDWFFSFIWRKIVESGIKARFTNGVLSNIKAHKRAFKVLCYLLIPILLILDTSIGFLLVSFYFVVCVSISITVECLCLSGSIILKGLRIVTEIPGHKVVKDAFRISGIVSTTLLVIANRFSFFYEMDEMFIDITEFVASAIIIPIIFEWIYSSNMTNAKNNISDK